MTLDYTKEVMKHFQKPRFLGEMRVYDGKGRVGNAVCGDVMEIFLKVKDNKIKDIKVKTFGCVAAISASDVVCELALGKTLDDAEKITANDVVKKLGKLPSEKIHCSLLGLDALKKAIEDYKKKKNQNPVKP